MHDKIRTYLTENGPQDADLEFSDDDSLLEAGIIDSMSMIDLISFLENEYSLKVDEDDMTPENFDSLNSIVEFISQKAG